jgi:hypothetical protein
MRARRRHRRHDEEEEELEGPRVATEPAPADRTVIPLRSWSWPDRTGIAGAGGAGPGKAHFSEVHLTVPLGTYSSELALASADGRAFKTVVLVTPGKDGTGATITLTDVLVERQSVNGNLQTLELNFAGYELSASPPAG